MLFLISYKISLSIDISYKLSSEETICIQCQILVFGKNANLFSKMLSAAFITQHPRHEVFPSQLFFFCIHRLIMSSMHLCHLRKKNNVICNKETSTIKLNIFFFTIGAILKGDDLSLPK